MSFWEGVSTDRFRRIIVERGYEDLGFYFTEGMRLTVEVLEGSFYRHGINVIPKTHCRDVKREEECQ
ncbi:hypothetical protein BAC3_01162 [uncultured bacterium]|nr:hypothetical protein BAC3_01162 [uncultured bacterium]